MRLKKRRVHFFTDIPKIMIVSVNLEIDSGKGSNKKVLMNAENSDPLHDRGSTAMPPYGRFNIKNCKNKNQ